MIDVTLTINDVDFSGWLSTYTVSHEVEVGTAITAIDGTEYASTRIRPVVNFTLIPMAESDIATAYNVLSAVNVSVVYTDPNFGSQTAVMRVTSNLEQVFGLRSVDGNRYYKGGTVTLRQRTVM